MAKSLALVVEDHGGAGYVLARRLMTLGFEVQLVTDVASARSALAAHAFEVLFLDLHLRAESGLDVLEGDLPLPSVVLTTSDPEGPALAARLGIAFLPKAFELEDLLRALTRARPPRTARGGQSLHGNDAVAFMAPEWVETDFDTSSAEQQALFLRRIASALDEGYMAPLPPALLGYLRMQLGRGVDIWTARKLRAQLAMRRRRG